MPLNVKLIALVGATALAGSSAVATHNTRDNEAQVRKETQQELGRRGQQVVPALRITRSKLVEGAKVDEETVGDANSFGRNVRWAGLMTADVSLAADCTPLPGDPPALPESRCVTLNAAPATTSFNFPDINRVTLPGKTAKSLLCHWWTPIISYTFNNPTAAPITATFRISPTLTVESPVLQDPSLIDSGTGLPFNGSLLTGMAASHFEQFTLAPGETRTWRDSTSRVCIGGALSKQNMVGSYGLTDALADEVFKKQMTVKLNLAGSVSGVADGQLYFGLRFVTD